MPPRARSRSLLVGFSSARDARNELRALHLGPGVREDAELLVSELATNALVHAGTEPYWLRVTCGPRRLRVEVGDGSALMPVMGEGSGVTGRGLRIVHALAACWGVDRAGPGKVVWAELQLPRRARSYPPSGPRLPR